MRIYFLPRVLDFNPRPREEGDGKDLSIIAIEDDFNPRPREEGDSASAGTAWKIMNFNPRPREEGDLSTLADNFCKTKFQSTPS